MVIGRHTAETCPGGTIRPDKQFSAKLDESMTKSGVKTFEGYSDGPGHTFYFIIEADDVTKLNNAVEPLRLVGSVDIVPVMRYSEGRVWARNIGVQK